MITSVVPDCRAESALPASTSMATIRLAPATALPWMTFSPTPPAPITATEAPGRTPAVLKTDPRPVTTAHPTVAALSRGDVRIDPGHGVLMHEHHLRKRPDSPVGMDNLPEP